MARIYFITFYIVTLVSFGKIFVGENLHIAEIKIFVNKIFTD